MLYAYPKVTGIYERSLNGRKADNTLDLAPVIFEEAKVAIAPARRSARPPTPAAPSRGGDTLQGGVQRVADLVRSWLA